MIHNSLSLILMESRPTSAAAQSWAVFRTPSHLNFRRMFWNRIIRAFKEPHFSVSITLEILKAWRLFFFSKWSKLYVVFENWIIIPENVIAFEDKCVGTCWMNFRLLWQEYMWLAVNVLKDAGNISDSTKRRDKQLTFFNINWKLFYKCGCGDLSSV